jgi:hypothetical protein
VSNLKSWVPGAVFLQEVFDTSFEAFVAGLEPGFVATFYYSGHGISTTDGHYIVPVDGHFDELEGALLAHHWRPLRLAASADYCRMLSPAILRTYRLHSAKRFAGTRLLHHSRGWRLRSVGRLPHWCRALQNHFSHVSMGPCVLNRPCPSLLTLYYQRRAVAVLPRNMLNRARCGLLPDWFARGRLASFAAVHGAPPGGCALARHGQRNSDFTGALLECAHRCPAEDWTDFRNVFTRTARAMRATRLRHGQLDLVRADCVVDQVFVAIPYPWRLHSPSPQPVAPIFPGP